MTDPIDKFKADLSEAEQDYANWYMEMERDEWVGYNTKQAEHDGWMQGQIDTLRSVIKTLEETQ